MFLTNKQKEEFIQSASTHYANTMTAQEILAELDKVANKMFMIDMIDHWSKEDSDTHDELYIKKIALQKAFAEVTSEK